jgi:transcriptional regulator with XRE-family HTH domain
MVAKKTDTFNVGRLINDVEVAKRLHVLRLYRVGGRRGSQTEWAKILGISTSRLNNLENGYPLARDMAARYCAGVSGLTLDWIFFGREEGLDPTLKLKLRDLWVSTNLSDEWAQSARLRSRSRKTSTNK